MRTRDIMALDAYTYYINKTECKAGTKAKS